jgi:hypothetical protein
VFEKPFKVEPEYEFWDTPERYYGRRPAEDVPDQIRVWRVQDSGLRWHGAVASPYGFLDSPDCEVLTTGYNIGKTEDYIAVARQGNFLYWGFDSPPSEMTKAGRDFYLNCICYIRRFDGMPPLIVNNWLFQSRDFVLAGYLRRAKVDEDIDGFFGKGFCKTRGGVEAAKTYVLENRELLYTPAEKFGDGDVYYVDEDLKALGIDSNRETMALETLVSLLDDPKHSRAAERLLKRYTLESFRIPAEWRAWFEENRGRFYFSDFGGYKFRVIPKGYLTRLE